ncbi:MAG: hypothetical protein FJ218_04985 [Ignavibacteria bacterium]|nr:hypothetical protein [Ignavibacteria bacterium]
MNTVKENLHNAIEQLSEEEASAVLTLVERVHQKESIDETIRTLRSSSLKLPQTPQKFQYVEPVSASGKSASQQLIDDRR